MTIKRQSRNDQFRVNERAPKRKGKERSERNLRNALHSKSHDWTHADEILEDFSFESVSYYDTDDRE